MTSTDDEEVREECRDSFVFHNKTFEGTTIQKRLGNFTDTWILFSIICIFSLVFADSSAQ